ncbi:MAG: hypothetical protein AB1297_04850 [bacterium]
MKKGVALVLAISAIFILLFVGIILVLLARKETGLTIALENRKKAFAHADGGADAAYAFLSSIGRATPQLQKGSITISLERGFFTKEGYHTAIKYILKRPIPGYGQGPWYLGGGTFYAFNYHIASSGFRGNTKRTIHLTAERVFPIER